MSKFAHCNRYEGLSIPYFGKAYTIIAISIITAWFFKACEEPVYSSQSTTDIVVFKFSKDVSPDRIQQLAKILEKRLNVSVSCGPLLSSYRLIMVGPSSRSNLCATAKRELRDLLPSSRIVRIPVLKEEGGNIQIPTGEMVVQFRQTVSDKDAKATLFRLKLKIIELPDIHTKGRYIVCDSEDNIKRLMESATALKKSGLVEYATLNMLQPLRH